MTVRHHPRNTWIGRLVRGWRLDRNPLRRGSDRTESVFFAVLFAAFLAAAPFAGHAAASWAAAVSHQEQQAQQATFRQVRAVLLQAPVIAPAVPNYGVALTSAADARWTAPDGQARTGVIPVPGTAKKGSAVPLWIDQSGQVAVPLQGSEITARSDLAAGAAVIALAIIFGLAGTAVRGVLTRRRLASWEADWLATGPHWTSRPNSDRE